MFSRDKSDLSLSSKEVEGEFTEELEDMAGESMVVMVRGEAGAGLGMLTLTRPILFITSPPRIGPLSYPGNSKSKTGARTAPIYNHLQLLYFLRSTPTNISYDS